MAPVLKMLMQLTMIYTACKTKDDVSPCTDELQM